MVTRTVVFCLCVFVFLGMVQVWGEVIFSEDFESGVLDPCVWDQQVDTGIGNSLSIEGGRLKAVFWSDEYANPQPCYAILREIALPGDWVELRVTGSWGYSAGTTGEGVLKVFEGGNESNYLSARCAAWQGPIFGYGDGCGHSGSTGAYSFPAIMTPFEFTVRRDGWTYTENGTTTLVDLDCDSMAGITGLQLKLGGWDMSRVVLNVYYFDDIVLSVRHEGDDGEHPIVIGELPYVVDGSTCDFGDDYDGCCGVGDSGADLVFRYDPCGDEYVNISLDRSSYDTRLYVYEDVVGDNDCCIACSDDDVRVNKSAFYHLALQGGHEYYIVVDGDNGECGNYHLVVEDGTILPEDCPGDSDFSQVVTGKFDEFHCGFSDEIYDIIRYESFSDLTNEYITRVTWWGVNLQMTYIGALHCEKYGEYFAIRLYEDDAGSVGTELKGWGDYPERVDTGLVYVFSNGEECPLYRYTMELDDPIALSAGWISIQGYYGGEECAACWMNSQEGDGSSLARDTYTGTWYTTDMDFSLCLQTQACEEMSLPYDPYPVNNATNVEQDLVLTWAVDCNMPMTYDVYMTHNWTENTEVLGLTEPRVGIDELWTDRGYTLIPGERYDWAVIGHNACFDQNGGDTWSFVAGDNWACDLDEDHNVDIWDLFLLASGWQESGCSTHNAWCDGMDMAKTGIVDLETFAILASHWLDNAPPLVNDDCAGAIAMEADVYYEGSTNGAIGYDMTYCGTGDIKDVWYSFTPSENAEYVFHLIADEAFDGTLGLFESCAGECVRCAVGFEYGENYYPPQLQMTLQAGQRYYLRVAGKHAVEGVFEVGVQNVLSLNSMGLLEYELYEELGGN